MSSFLASNYVFKLYTFFYVVLVCDEEFTFVFLVLSLHLNPVLFGK